MHTPHFSRRNHLAATYAIVALTAGTFAIAKADAASYHPSGQEQQAIAKLITDLQSIRAGSEVTDAERQALAADLQVLATSTTKPSATSVDQLVDDLAAALSDGSVSVVEKAALTLDLDAVFNSAGLSTAQAEQFISDIQAILVSSGVSAADVQLIASDLALVAADVQVNFLVADTSFPLAPVVAGGTSSGRARLTASTRNDGSTTRALTLSTLGLTTGSYTVTATTASTGAVTLGTLTVVGLQGHPGVGAVIFGDAADTPFPSGFDAAQLVSVTLTDAAGTVQLSGTVADATKTNRLGNFRLVAGPAAPSALGNAAFKVKTKAGGTREFFLLYARKLPVSAALTLKANGVAVGAVTTDARGRLLIDAGNVVVPVKADGVTPLLTPTPLPAGVDLGTLESLELDDASGQIVATAGFAS